jgi:hypothetical protein
MSTTATHPPAPPSLVSPVPVATRIQPRRRRPGLIAFGILAVVLGALGASFLVLSIGNTSGYLAVARPVSIGTKLTAADLRVVNINAAPGLSPIPAEERSRVLERYAKVDLVPGSLLTVDQLTETAGPAQGQQLIGIGLKSGNLPAARSLRAGDSLLIVVLPDPRTVSVDPSPKASGQAPQVNNQNTFKCTVFGASKPHPDGQVVIDVIVRSSDGPAILAYASQGRISVALVPKG